MVKKLIASILAASFVLCICSCEKQKDEDVSTSAEEKKQTRKVVDYSSAFSEITDIEPDNTFQKSGKIDKTLIYDDSGIKITAESIEYLDDHAELSLSVENTNDFTLGFDSSEISVNSYQNTDAGWFCVNAGTTDI